jgi:hypothetical protein
MKLKNKIIKFALVPDKIRYNEEKNKHNKIKTTEEGKN